MNLLILAPASVLNWLSICSTADNLYMPREVFNNLLQNSSQTLSRSWVLKLYWEWGIYRFSPLLKSFRTIFVPIQFPCRGGEQIRESGCVRSISRLLQGKTSEKRNISKTLQILCLVHLINRGEVRSGDMALGFIRLCWFQVKMS